MVELVPIVPNAARYDCSIGTERNPRRQNGSASDIKTAGDLIARSTYKDSCCQISTSQYTRFVEFVWPIRH